MTQDRRDSAADSLGVLAEMLLPQRFGVWAEPAPGEEARG
jgi:hypothetical protein